MFTPHFPSDPAGILAYTVGLVALWIIVSVPVYFAGRAVKGREASFGNAMGATLGGVLAYYIVFFLVAIFLGAVLGSAAGVLGLFTGLLAWLWVFKGAFHTSWPGAVGIVVVAWLILIVLDTFLVSIFGVRFPNFYPF